jgi:hypothetical protein
LKKSSFGGGIRKVSGSIGKSVTSGTSTVWRRSHVAIKPVTITFPKSKAIIKATPKMQRLGPTELVLAGDSWAYAYSPNDIMGTCSDPIHGLVAGKLKQYVYYRMKSVVDAKREKKVSAVDKNPLISFTYPVSREPWKETKRQVRLISANEKYIVGLEVSDKNRFKKFLSSKASSLKMLEYSSSSMP